MGEMRSARGIAQPTGPSWFSEWEMLEVAIANQLLV